MSHVRVKFKQVTARTAHAAPAESVSLSAEAEAEPGVPQKRRVAAASPSRILFLIFEIFQVSHRDEKSETRKYAARGVTRGITLYSY